MVAALTLVVLIAGTMACGALVNEGRWHRRIRNSGPFQAVMPTVEINGQLPTAELRVLIYEGEHGHGTGIMWMNAAVERKREYANMAIGAIEQALNDPDLDG